MDTKTTVTYFVESDEVVGEFDYGDAPGFSARVIIRWRAEVTTDLTDIVSREVIGYRVEFGMLNVPREQRQVGQTHVLSMNGLEFDFLRNLIFRATSKAEEV